MRLSPRSQIVATLGLIMALVLTSCAAPKPTPAPAPTAPAPTAPAPTAPAPTGPYGELKVAVVSLGIEDFDPIGSGGIIAAPVLDYFIRTDPIIAGEELHVGTGIAERWEIAPDGLSWTFYIRKGIKFHNGDPLTARDVKFNLDRYATLDAYYPHIRDRQERVVVVDDYTVRAYTKGTQPYLLTFLGLAMGWNGMIMPKAYTEKIGLEAFKTRPVGTGPFKFVSRVPGDNIVYEAMTEHYRQVPAFKKVTMIVVPEEATRVAMMKTGALDITTIGYDAVPQLEAAGIKTDSLMGGMPHFVIFGALDPRAKGIPASDIRVREALSLAINRDEIGSTLFYGKMGPAMPARQFPDQAGIDLAYWKAEAAKFYRYDLERAKQLLKEAGYADGFNLKLYYLTGTAYLPSLVASVQGYWLKIGVKADISPMELAALRPMWGFGPQGIPVDALVGQVGMYAPSVMIPAPMALTGSAYPTGSPYLLHRGTPPAPEIASLIDASLMEINDAKRGEATAKLLRMTMDTRLDQMIGYAPTLVAIGSRVDIDFPPGAPSRISQFLELAKHGK